MPMKKRTTLIIAFIAGIVVLAMILLPGLALIYIEKHSKEYIGRKITIDRVSLNYLTTTLRVRGFKLYEQDDKEVFVAFDRMLVNLQPLNLMRNEILIEQFNLSGLYAHVIHEDSVFNFTDIIEFLNKPADSAEIAKDTISGKPWNFRLYDFRLIGSNFEYDDRKVGKVTRLKDFDLEIPFLAWGGEDSDADVKFSFDDSGSFEANINLDPANGDYQAAVTISGLQVEAIREYLAYYTGIQSVSGMFNCQADLTGNIHTPAEILVAGKIWLQDLGMTDAGGDRFIGAERLDIGMKRIDYSRSRYEFDSLILTGPYVHFVLWDSTNNLSTAFSSPGDTLAGEDIAIDSTDATERNDLFYSVEAFRIRNGMIDYTDHLTDQPFDYHLSEIQLEADSLTTDAKWVNLYSSMLLNNRGTLKAEVGFNPADPVRNISLNYVITDFMLTDLNIHSRHFTGIPILLGEMYYKSETRIEEGQLSSENKLIMSNVELGNKRGGIYDLPIKLALFILKDRHGVINLDIPVRGNLDDPRVRLGRIIWNTFRNLIVKVATSPFDALAGELGADPGDLEFIQFDYLDTSLTDRKQRQLDLLLQLELQKPGLDMELVYFNDKEQEKQQMILAGVDLPEEEMNLQLEALKAIRIGSLENYLKSRRAATTIHLSESDARDPENLGSRPKFKVVYSLAEGLE